MKIAIYSRGLEENQHKEINVLLHELVQHDVEPVFYQEFFNKFYSAVDFKSKYSTFSSADDLDDTVDFMISLGGDGTLLDTVTFG
jgi:NAD+ kinase